MINLLLYGILGFVGIKAMGAVKSATPDQVRNTRSQVPIGVSSGVVNVPHAGNPISGAASGLSHPAGNANQPWYNAGLAAGAGVAGKELIGGIASLFKTSASPQVETTIDDEELADAESEYGTSSYSSTSDDEDFYDEAYDSEYASSDESYGDYEV